jgi:copper chaperone CopZ
MRPFLIAAVATVAIAALSLGQARADKVEVKGTHLCCDRCLETVQAVLAKVDGVSDVATDKKAKTVSFTAKDAKVATAGIKALADAGFFGTVTTDDKETKIDVPEVKKGTKAETVTVKDVHVCCGNCKEGISKALKDLKITYDGEGVQKTVKVEGKDLDAVDIIAALRKAGYNGTVAK